MTALSDLFSAGAHRYDLLVGANPGYHRHLRLAAERIARHVPARRVLDLGCGTGASTRALLRAMPHARVRGVDASTGMIERARARAWPTGRVSFTVGEAGDDAPVADALPFDACLAAYLLRNVPVAERDRVLGALHDQLRPGAVVAVQDYSVRAPRPAGGADRLVVPAAAVWWAVAHLVVIPLAAITLRDTRLFRYLHRSVMAMESPEAWCARLRDAGFEVVEVHRGSGWQRGILHTVIARRP